MTHDLTKEGLRDDALEARLVDPRKNCGTMNMERESLRDT
jgi:hypothetical protein